MSIASDLIRGNTDMIILSHLARGDSYGYEINKKIQQATEKRLELKEATLYGAFRRLEEAGCIMFYWGDEMTGARRRYYRITPEGRAALEQSLRDWAETKEIIEILVGGKPHDGQN